MTFLPNEIRQPDPDQKTESPRSILRSHETCQWIEGPVTGAEDCKCGKPVRPGLPGRAPYCTEHAKRCFESRAAWKKRNALIGDLDGSFATVSLQDWMGGLE